MVDSAPEAGILPGLSTIHYIHWDSPRTFHYTLYTRILPGLSRPSREKSPQSLTLIVLDMAPKVQCTVYSVQCTVYSVQCKVYIVQCTVYSVQCTVYTVHCKVYTVQ